ncbi:hypothetical protein RI119_18510 [Bacillus amyloliquefaciens]|uniref:hypothetical protein n=1 Tax=Bacillus amyloliquefaciens TaxID=1390 RepID=UPI003757077E
MKGQELGSMIIAPLVSCLILQVNSECLRSFSDCFLAFVFWQPSGLPVFKYAETLPLRQGLFYD